MSIEEQGQYRWIFPPRRRIDGPKPAARTFRKWAWPHTKSYNGFTPTERIRGWQVTWWLVAKGVLPEPHSIPCEVCSATEKTAWHNENYYAPWNADVLCRSCHALVHRRFRNPDGWLEFVGRHPGSVVNLEAFSHHEAFNMAGDLRQTHGRSVLGFPDMCAAYGDEFDVASLYPL